MKKKIVFTLTALTAVLVFIFSGIFLFRRELTRRLSLVSVPISVSTLPPRHLITVDDLTWIDVPSAYLQADILREEAELVGLWTRLEGTIPAGSFFYQEMLDAPEAMADFSVRYSNRKLLRYEQREIS